MITVGDSRGVFGLLRSGGLVSQVDIDTTVFPALGGSWFSTLWLWLICHLWTPPHSQSLTDFPVTSTQHPGLPLTQQSCQSTHRMFSLVKFFSLWLWENKGLLTKLLWKGGQTNLVCSRQLRSKQQRSSPLVSVFYGRKNISLGTQWKPLFTMLLRRNIFFCINMKGYLRGLIWEDISLPHFLFINST